MGLDNLLRHKSRIYKEALPDGPMSYPDDSMDNPVGMQSYSDDVNSSYEEIGNDIVQQDHLTQVVGELAQESDPKEAFRKGYDLLPDCESEDSHNCFWDANGEGTSFVTIAVGDGKLRTFYEDGKVEDWDR